MWGSRLLLVLLLSSLISLPVLATPGVFHPASEIKGGTLGSDFGAQNFTVNGTFTVTGGGLKITGSAPTITGFAADATLGGGSASNGTLPTEWAVKRYVDSQVSSGASGWTDSGSTVSLTTSSDNVNASALYVDNTNGRVGIGTSAPSQALDVVGNAILNGTGRSLQIGTTGCQTLYFANSNNKIEFCNNQFGFNTTQTNGYTFSGGNVGIGTTAPGAKLEVTGSGNENGVLIDGANRPYVSFNKGNTGGNWTLVAGFGDGLFFKPNYPGNNTADTDSVLSLKPSGAVGIKQRDPTSTLSVNGSLNLQSGASITGFSTSTSLGTSNSLVPTQAAVKSYVDSQVSASGSMSNFTFAGDSGSSIIGNGQTATVAGGTGINTSESGGTVTVGITPNSIDGAQLANTITLDSNLGITQGSYDTNFDAGTLVVKGSTNRVGIGTTNPTARLEVVGSEDTSRIAQDSGYVYTELAQRGWSGSFGTLYNAYKTPSASSVSGDLFATGNTKYKRSSGTYGLSAAAIGGYLNSGANGGTLRFYSAPNGTADQNVTWTQIAEFNLHDVWLSPNGTATDFYINTAGNVGIGTSSPGAKLDVTGDLILQNGVAVNGFATDTTLGGASSSNSLVPTQAAVKSYVDNQIATGAGDVTGPGSSTSNAIAKYSGTTGKVIANSGVTIDSSNNVAGIANLSVSSRATLGSFFDSATGLGKVGNYGFDGSTNTSAEWSALPVGYSRMMGSGIGTAGGAPVSNYGYFTKVANRDVSGGWAGIWVGYSAGQDYIGRAPDSSTLPTWDKIWTSANDGPGSGLNADLLDGANLSTSTSLGTSNTLVPTQNAVKAYVDAQVAASGSMSNFTFAGDSGSSIIGNGQTAKVAGGTGINTSESGGTVTVGITPNSINGAQLANTITLDSNLGITQGSYTVNFDSNTLFINGSNNRVGIGTTKPANSLTVKGNLGVNGTLDLYSTGSTTPGYGNTWTVSSPDFNSVISGTMAGGNDYYRISGNGTGDAGALIIQTGDNGNEPIVFAQNNGGTFLERLRIDSSGRLAFPTGAAIDTFSTATNLGGASPSNNAVPTQAAVKSYVDSAIGAAGNVSSVGLSLPSEFSVTGSPVTSSGTLTATWASESANRVFASPSGTAGTPSFRALVAGDIPSLDASKITTGEFNYARVRQMESKDTRSTNLNPENYTPSVQADFKQNSADGLTDGGTYHGVITFRPYGTGTDLSGGPVHQLAFTQNGNLWQRVSTGTTSWGPWTEIQNGINSTTCTYGIASIGTDGTVTCASQQGTGDVSGPGSSTTNAIAKFSGTTGKVIANSGVTIDSSNNVATSGSVSAGSVTSTGAVAAGSVKTSGILNQTGTGVVQAFSNGCSMTANSSGLYWNC